MMRNIPIIVMLAFFATGFYTCGQKTENRSVKESIIEFDTLSHNFGEIEFNGDGDVEFIFTNSGKAPLIITHVKSTCGCTIPEWPKEPFAAGEKGRIHVSYNTRRIGSFTKTIYVYSNAVNGVKKLVISGKVQPVDS